MTSRRKVLVVDDSEVGREIVRVALEVRGHAVVCAESPIGLTRLVNVERPHLLLIDVAMPAISGDKVVALLLGNQQHRCPIVFYSDLAADKLEELTRRSGASGFIRKTNDLELLAASAEGFLPTG